MATNCKVILKGNLGQDPQLHRNAEGQEFAFVRVATTDSYPDKSTGQWKNKETVWHDVAIFRTSAVKFAKEMKKGERVHIEGVLTYKSVESKDGFQIPQASIVAGYIAKAPLPSKDEEGAETTSLT